MKLDRSVKLLNRFRGEIASTFGDASRNCKPHHEILVAMKWRVWGQDDYKKLPQWAKGQLTGYFDGHMAALSRERLEWRVRLDGVYIRSEDVPEGRWQDVMPGNHFYKGSDVMFGTPGDD